MANTGSAIRAARENERKRQRNRMATSAMRTYVKKANLAIESGDKELSADALHAAIVALDKAAEKGRIHKNKAARSKSRLMRRFNNMAEE